MSNNNNGIIIIGNGGHARSVRDVIASMNGYSISCEGKVFVASSIEDSRECNWDFTAANRPHNPYFIAIGQIKSAGQRKAVAQILHERDLRTCTLISPHAFVSPYAKIGEGTVVMPGAIVNTCAEIGAYCIINTGAIIEHDAKVGNFCHVSTGAVVNGEAEVGHSSFIGSNSVVLNQIKIGKNIILGAGSIAVTDIMEPGIYRGNPCGRIK